MAQNVDPFTYAHQHFREVVWMSQNTNHLFPPQEIERAVTEALREKRYEEYPFAPGLSELKDLLQLDYGLRGVKIGITAGGTEALYMMARALLGPGDEVVSTDPSYLIIHKFVNLAGAATKNLDIYEPPYRLTADRVASAIGPKTKMIVLIDPLNPLGSGYPAEDVKAIAEIAKDKKVLLLHDVTYRDFADQHTLAHTFAPEQTITVWSLSKNCGLAGLRLGGLMAAPELFDQIWKYNTNDLGVNVLAQYAGVAAMKAKPRLFPGIKAQVAKNQQAIRGVVESVKGATLPVFPSQANMFVIDIAPLGIAPEKLQAELLFKHQVFVRAGNYLSPKFGSRFFRVSFSNSAEDIDKFVQALPAALAATRTA